MKLLILSLFLFTTSCSLFKTYSLSRDISKESQKICLTGNGKGRLSVNGRRYVFSYENLLDKEHNNWILGLDFPLRNQETIELDWSKPNKVKFKTSIETRLLREQKDINPRELNFFINRFGNLLHDIMILRDGSQSEKGTKLDWKVSKKYLMASSHKGLIEARFENLDAQGYFNLSSFIYRDRQTKSEKYKIEFILGSCEE